MPDSLQEMSVKVNRLMSQVGTAGPPGLAGVIPTGLTERIDALEQVVFNVKDAAYGAAGDGATDDTAAIQAAITAGCTVGGHVFLPAGTYKITAALLIPFAGGWTIEGASRNGTTIVQYTSNTPIFKFTHTDTWGWRIANMALTYASAQPSTNTAAGAFYFVGDASTTFFFAYSAIAENLYFANCCDCFSTDSTKKVSVWGFTMRNLYVASTVSRSVATFTASSTFGQPNNRYEHIYVVATTMVGPIFQTPGADNTSFDAIEINTMLLSPIVLYDLSGGRYSIGAMKCEGGTYDTNNVMFYLANSYMTVKSLAIDTMTFTPTATPYMFRTGGGADTYVGIDVLVVAGITVTSGTVYVSNFDGGSDGYMEVGKILPASPILPTNVQLTDIGSTNASAGTSVAAWNAGRVSANKGDADYTVAIGDDTIISYETALTAARTVTLPNPTAQSNLFDGLRYRVMRTGGGAFDLKINKAPATLLDSIVSGKTGVIEYTYRRNTWFQTLKAVI